MSEVAWYLIKANSVIVVFYLFYVSVLSTSTYFHINRIYLLFLIIASLALPLVDVGHSTLSIDQYSFDISLEESLRMSGTSMKGIFKQPISSEISLGALLLLAYIVGLMARILIFSFSIFRMINLANNKLIGVMDSYKLIPIDRPIVAGSFFRSIFLGVLFEKLSSQEKEIILRHEKIHLDQAHTFDLILVELISILFWFNPVIRLVKKSLRNVHEYCTDQVVSKNATTSYSELLLSLASDCKEYSIGHNFSAFQLKKRIKMLSKKRTSRFHLSKMVLLIPVIAGLLFSFSQTTKERDISLYWSQSLVKTMHF